MIESTIQHRLVQRLREEGLYVVKCNLMSVTGWPDLQVLHDNKVVFIECKSPGKKPRPLQEHIHNKLRNMNFQVLVFDGSQSIDEIVKICKQQ